MGNEALKISFPLVHMNTYMCHDDCTNWNCDLPHSEDRIQKCEDVLNGVNCTNESCKRFFLHPEQPLVNMFQKGLL